MEIIITDMDSLKDKFVREVLEGGELKKEYSSESFEFCFDFREKEREYCKKIIQKYLGAREKYNTARFSIKKIWIQLCNGDDFSKLNDYFSQNKPTHTFINNFYRCNIQESSDPEVNLTLDFKNFTVESEKLLNNFLELYNTIEIKKVKSANIKIINVQNIKNIVIPVKKPNDYSIFYDFFTKKDDIKLKLNSKGEIEIDPQFVNTTFKFDVFDNGKDKINELLLHNYLLIKNKSKHAKFVVNIRSERIENTSDKMRLLTYLAYDTYDNRKNNILLFNKPLRGTPSSTGRKLLPALYIERETLSFLQRPITIEIWKKIIGDREIKKETYRDISDVLSNKIMKRYWRILRTLQSYLLDDLHKIRNTSYKELRKKLFRHDSFYEKILRMPFLAVLIFAQYDYYYKTTLLTRYNNGIKLKSNKKRVSFNHADFLMSKQRDQDFDRYCVFKELKERGYDLKNFFQGEKDEDIHGEIIAELFEAHTIAEGLLQLIENAVIHAGGGLLSMHIYRYDEKVKRGITSDKIDHDNSYLESTYRVYKYFQNIEKENEEKNKKKVPEFFLEIKLSDVSNKNMKEKFIENVKKRKENNERLRDWYAQHLLPGNHEKYSIYQLFFKPHKEELFFWKEYYKIAENNIYHYGLQIFDSTIDSKNGLFVASGHGETYINIGMDTNEFDHIIDKNVPGTSYQILLPLSHTYTENQNIIGSVKFTENMMSVDEVKEYYENGNGEIRTKVFEFKDKFGQPLKGEYGDQDEKNEIIKNLRKEIEDKIKDFQQNKKFLFIIKMNSAVKMNVEIVIKSLFAALVESKDKPPVAIIGLSSHQLLECVRNISLFYDRNGEGISLSDIQVYLKGNKAGEEIIMAGQDLNWTAYYMRKISMTKGIMFDYWSIAQRMMQRNEAKQSMIGENK